MALIELKDVCAGYGKNVILKDFCIDIAEGKLVSLLGPSGCGKTTTLRTMAGFIDVLSGRFLFNGQDFSHVPIHKRGFGYVFQSYALFPHLNVFDNVAFGLRQQKVPKAEIAQRVSAMLERVNLSGYEKRLPAEMSGGQRQRVALARSLVLKPKLLLLDEPLSNLDAKLRVQMRVEIRRLQQEMGITTVYVTHDQMEAMTLATQICLIENGVLQQYDAPLTVYHQPNNLFVADFVGNPSINFVEAKGAQRADGAVELTVFQGRKALFRPSTPLDLPQWFRDRAAQAAAWEEAHRKRAAEKSYVEKGNKDEAFRYHIAKVVEDDDSLQDDPVLTDQDLVLGIRPEFLDIADQSPLEGEIYGAMPTGMESTIKVRVDDFLLTGVIFGSSLFTIGEKVPVTVSGDNIMLFHRKSGACIATGSLEL